MRRAVVLVLVGVLLLGACGGDEDEAADTSAASTNAPRGEQIVIRTRMVVAAAPGAEPIATGDVLEGSTLAGSPFCAGGTIRDSHGSSDPAVRLIVETDALEDGHDQAYPLGGSRSAAVLAMLWESVLATRPKGEEMPTTIRSRFTREDGQTMTEYAVTLAVITVATVGIFAALSGRISAAINNVVALF